MKTLILILIAILEIPLGSGSTLAYRENCFFNHEVTQGASKICYYQCTCGTKALNVKSYDICPLTVNFSCY